MKINKLKHNYINNTKYKKKCVFNYAKENDVSLLIYF